MRKTRKSFIFEAYKIDKNYVRIANKAISLRDSPICLAKIFI